MLFSIENPCLDPAVGYHQVEVVPYVEMIQKNVKIKLRLKRALPDIINMIKNIYVPLHVDIS